MPQLFYRTPVPVNSEKQRDWYVRTGGTYAFASEANSVPRTAIEFGQAAAEYSIVFAGSGKEVFPAVILGTQQDQNLFVGPDDTWQSRYVPAFVRRCPFVFSLDEAKRIFTLLIDETFKGCNQTGRGGRLFDADGALTHYLRTVLGFLQELRGTLPPHPGLLRLPRRAGSAAAHAGAVHAEHRRAALTLRLQRGESAEPEGANRGDDGRAACQGELGCTLLHLASLGYFQNMLERFQPRQKTIGVEIYCCR